MGIHSYALGYEPNNDGIMTIHLYLDNDAETEVASFYEMTSNPFKLGDVVHVTVDDLSPKELHEFSRVETVRENLLKEHNIKREKFRRKAVKLVREGKYITTKALRTDTLTIEYHCKIIENE